MAPFSSPFNGSFSVFNQQRSNSLTSFSLTELIRNEDWKLAMMAINPKSASQWTHVAGFFDGEHDSKVLPIHHACALHPPKEVIDKLYEAYPEGFHSKESAYQRLPLHVACQSDASASAIQALLECDVTAAQCKDSLGRVPLHYACSHGAPVEVVAVMLQAFPASAGCVDKRGWLPLHVACRFGDNESVIRLLIKELPASLYTTTKRGTTPLMCAKKVADSPKHQAVVNVLESFMTKAVFADSVMKQHSSPRALLAHQHNGMRQRRGMNAIAA